LHLQVVLQVILRGQGQKCGGATRQRSDEAGGRIQDGGERGEQFRASTNRDIKIVSDAKVWG